MFAWFYNLLIRANERIKQEIAKKENGDKNVFGGIIIVLALNFVWPIFLPYTRRLYHAMLMMPVSESEDLLQTVWYICMTGKN